MERRCPIAVGFSDNAKFHHVLGIGLRNALLHRIKAPIPLEGYWTGHLDVMDSIMWWRITGAGAVREVGILPKELRA